MLSVLDCLPNALVNTILMNSLVTLLLVIVYIIWGFYVGLTTYSGMARNDLKSLNMVLFQSCCNDFCLCSQQFNMLRYKLDIDYSICISISKSCLTPGPSRLIIRQ